MNPSLKLGGLLDPVLRALAQRRPIFHSEADFQLALAWEIQTARSAASIRLEQRVLDSPRVNLDILVVLDGLRFGLELKYLRAGTDVTVGGERFVLVVGAPDLDRYDTVKDIVRLERLVNEQLVDAGAVVVLTNSSSLWQPSSTGRPTGYDAFRIHDGATLSGTLEWGLTAGTGTRKGREAAHLVAGIYQPRWQPFSRVGPGAAHEFRTLTLLVPPA
jgi:hypothetical protein